MKKSIKFLAITFVMFGLGITAMAQTVGTANAAAVIIEPITITKNSDLNFGTIMRGTAASTIVVTTAGARSVGSGDAILSALAPVAAAASFTIDGSDGASYAVTIPSANINITSGANTMSVGTWSSNPVAPISGTFPAGSGVTLLIGATLNVGAAQASGSYTGTFNISVDYN